MATVSLKHIGKVYANGVEAVKDFNLEVKDKEFIILVGPSGCGKSTTLRMIAGLEAITSGELRIDGRLMNEVEPKDRDIAMVFQNYALYPYMTVYENMAFSLKLRKTPKEEIRKKVEEVAGILGIGDLLKRKPKALSGGQKQRVAMGRAMVRNPRVFLMDEPLSNLDAKLRVQMRTEIAALHNRLGATFIYVTHDQTEAMTLGNRIVVLRDGVIMQADSPQKLYNQPDNLFVAGFIGSPPMNFINAVCQADGENCYLQFEKTTIRLPAERAKVLTEGGYNGKTVVIGVRPENVHECGKPASGERPEVIETQVTGYELLGAEALLHYEIGGSDQCARVAADRTAQYGDPLFLTIDVDKMHVFDKEAGQNILKNTNRCS